MQALMEMISRTPLIIVQEIGWALLGQSISLLLAYLLCRVFIGLNLRTILYEIEEDNNVGVGAIIAAVQISCGLALAGYSLVHTLRPVG